MLFSKLSVLPFTLFLFSVASFSQQPFQNSTLRAYCDGLEGIESMRKLDALTKATDDAFKKLDEAYANLDRACRLYNVKREQVGGTRDRAVKAQEDLEPILNAYRPLAVSLNTKLDEKIASLEKENPLCVKALSQMKRHLSTRENGIAQMKTCAN